MKIITDNISVRTKGNTDIIDLTGDVQNIITNSELKNGSATVFIVGSTASITTIEYEPGLKKDMPEILDRIIPSDRTYNHNYTWGDHNGHSHLRASIIGCSKTIPFVEGELMNGTWQQIVLIDFDEKSRTRKVIVQLIGE